MITTQKEIQKMASAWQQSRALLAAVELKLFSHVGSGATSADIATAAGTDPRCTDRLLNVMVTLGFMGKSGEVYTNGPAAAQFLVEGEDEYLSSLFHTAYTYRNWGTLAEAVKAGTAVIDLGWDSDERRDAFIEAMHRRARNDADQLVASFDLTDVSRVLDVGGGSGAYSMAMCRTRDGLTSTILDLPEVTPLTQRYIFAEGMTDRIETKDGSYHEADYGTGYDLVLFSAIVHINSAAENQNLMNRAYGALNSGGLIAVQDFIMEEDRLTPPSGAMFALNMVVTTRAGDTYTREEIKGWLKNAGCDDIQFIKTGPVTSMVTGRKS